MADVYVTVYEPTPAVSVVVNPVVPQPDPIVIVTSTSISEVTGIVFENDEYISDGIVSAYTLTYTPIQVISVDNNGLIQLPSDYTVLAGVVTLDYTPLDGDIINITYSK